MYSVPVIVTVALLEMIEIEVWIVYVDLMFKSHDLYVSPEKDTGPSDVSKLELYRHDEFARDVISGWNPRVLEKQMNRKNV